MVARNDITGDAIQTKGVTNAYRDNYENIFRKDKTDMQVRVKEDKEEIGKCGCGRSPTGYCIGWHGYTEEEFKSAQHKWAIREAQEKGMVRGDKVAVPGYPDGIESEGGEID